MVSNFAVGQDLRLVATPDTMTGNGHSDPHVSCCKKCTGDQPTDYLVNGFSASPGETPSNGALSSPTYDRNSASDKNERGCKDKEVESPQSQPPSQTTVLIIGGGPTGLLASILLAKRGLHSTILEQHAQRLGQPKAHAINPRSLEILRQAGLDTNTLRKLGAAPSDADAVRFVLSITGLEIGQLPYERQDEQVKQLTPEPLFNIPQPLLEEYLRKTALDTGMVTVWRGWRWQDGVESRDKTILSKVLDRRTQNEIYITSRYLLGCDGAHALSRACFGIPFDTVDGLPSCPIHYCSVNFDADMSSEKSGMLWFIMTKTAGKRNFIAYNRKNNWVFVTRYDPNTTPATTFTEDYCRSLIDQVSPFLSLLLE
jgi:2,4-dichlorophenol 6-monooxygenase